MKTRKAYLVENGHFEIRTEEIIPQREQVLVKVASCGLCNWELNHWKGRIGQNPQFLGHEAAGIVVELGENVTEFSVGDKVTGFMGGFSEYVAVPTWNVFKLAEHINPVYGFSEPLKCVVTVITSAKARVGDVAVIVGCGAMGLWCIQALKSDAMQTIIAVDIDDKRLALAKKYGAMHCINPSKVNTSESIAKITQGRMADFVIEGTGNGNVLSECINYVKHGRGKIIAMSSYERLPEKFNLTACVEKGIEIIFAHPSYSKNAYEDLRRAVNLINKGVFKIEELVTHKFSLDEINSAFQTLENKPDGYIKGIIIP
ncbi:MAG: zinc-binding dehydrogenase [Lentimicrobiaceae bacterium]|nr:zinc-binding dehydrogenase [Lentimicrobiaceae bacterium]